jgi:hypothetical protein
VRFIFVSSLLLTEPKVYHAHSDCGRGKRREWSAETRWSVGAVWVGWSCHMSKLGLGFGRRVMTHSDRGDRGGGCVVR